ncbi:MAG TPA: thiosulfohydrolase SoxB, partial [Alphaproteobacteria bacterium]|nr:thiosulfohydrolase SoxB [Alphaproteobacteria bacterium]
MYSRREFLQVTAATAAILGTNTPLGAWAAGQKITQDQLLDFEAKGNVTLLHLTDIHAQLVPVYFREPSVNLGVGEVNGLVPHITGQDFLTRYDLKRNTLDAYALTYLDFNEMAQVYGRVGGIDRMKTVVDAIRAERPENTLLLDGGDTWQGSYTSYKTQGMDMVQVMNALGVDAMTAHWEFTYGTDRVNELIEALDFPFLVGNVRDTEWDEPVFEAINYFERGGVKIAVIGQAFPYTPIANPRYMIPEYSFGIREEEMAKNVEKARANGAELVVVVSHNGFDTDRKMAQRVKGIDVLLSGHTHDAVPEAVQVGKTLLIASGSHGKFLSRLDLDVQGGEVRDYSFRLIPILSDVITPDPEMRKLVQEIRAPHEQELRRELAKTESTLFRRGNFNGTFDDL